MLRDLNIKIKKAKHDKEIQINEHRIYIDNNLLHIICIGDIDKKTALEFRKKVRRLLKQIGKKMNIFADINRIGYVSSEARIIFKEMFENPIFGRGKIAIFGLHPVAKVVASFFVRFSKSKDYIRFFNNKEDAIRWLNKESTDIEGS